MEILTFIKLASPLILAIIAITGYLVRLQTKLVNLCITMGRVQAHISDLLRYQNQSEVIIKSATVRIDKLEAALFARSEKTDSAIKDIWSELDKDGNRITTLEARTE
tara:strand:- start:16054 stop:16374 length:321 start_codon:yes stop_codon:yes gene_type:complete